MAQSLNIEVVLDNIDNNPHCFHGPTLLFRKFKTEGVGYYACSASRDRKQCSFYLKETELSLNKQSQKAEEARKSSLLLYKNQYKMMKKLKKLKEKERGYCHSCQCLFGSKDLSTHSKCSKSIGLSNKLLGHPTEIVLPKENDKVEAQYLFSSETTTVIVNVLKAMHVSGVLCVGTPRIHETLLNSADLNIKSLLLDIDHKYHNFYDQSQFIWFNMFNNFLMNAESASTLEEFFRCEGKLGILMDPPFGGRVEPIALTLKKLNAQYNLLNGHHKLKDLGVMWFFPYFMERHIQDSLPDFRMLDYQVNYENHASFSDKGARRRKTGSPVRIFTNIPLSEFDLTGVSGYHLCPKCCYWVSDSNWHCSECESCTSKNGSRYNHCHICKKCVKPSFSHCETCERCCITTHVCGQFQPDTNCYHCHLPGHKKSHCPQLLHPSKKKKLK